jgi:hypothetical protein
MSNYWNIKLYTTENGNYSVEGWLSQQAPRVQNKIDYIIRYLEVTPPPWPTKYYEKLKGYDDLHEIKIQAKGDPYRLLGYFGPTDRTFSVFLGAREVGKKSYLPPNALDIADRYKKNFLSGRGKIDDYRGP